MNQLHRDGVRKLNIFCLFFPLQSLRVLSLRVILLDMDIDFLRSLVTGIDAGESGPPTNSYSDECEQKAPSLHPTWVSGGIRDRSNVSETFVDLCLPLLLRDNYANG